MLFQRTDKKIFVDINREGPGDSFIIKLKARSAIVSGKIEAAKRCNNSPIISLTQQKFQAICGIEDSHF